MATSKAPVLPSVELRHVAVIVAVADTGSFRAAALRLGYAQSAVSQLIAALERATGVALIQRSRGPAPIALTPQGAAVVAHGRRVLARMHAALADLDAVGDGGPAAVRIGIDPSIVKRVLPRFLEALRHEQPDRAVEPVELAEQHARVALVELGELDAAFVHMPLPAGPLSAMPLLADPFMLVVPADATVASLGRDAGLADLAGLRLLGRSAELLANAAHAGGGNGEPTAAAVQSLVAAGHGAAVLPSLALDTQPGTVELGVGNLIAPRVLGLCWHGDRRAAADVQALRRAAARAFPGPARPG